MNAGTQGRTKTHTITVRMVPDEVHKVLKIHGRNQYKSMEEACRDALERQAKRLLRLEGGGSA